MAANELVRERIRRKLARATKDLVEDFERIEFWAAVLDALAQPIPPYEPPCEFLLKPNSAGPDGTGKPSGLAAAFSAPFRGPVLGRRVTQKILVIIMTYTPSLWAVRTPFFMRHHSHK